MAHWAKMDYLNRFEYVNILSLQRSGLISQDLFKVENNDA